MINKHEKIAELNKFIVWLSFRIQSPRESDDTDKLIVLRRSLIAEINSLQS